MEFFKLCNFNEYVCFLIYKYLVLKEIDVFFIYGKIELDFYIFKGE